MGLLLPVGLLQDPDKRHASSSPIAETNSKDSRFASAASPVSPTIASASPPSAFAISSWCTVRSVFTVPRMLPMTPPTFSPATRLWLMRNKKGGAHILSPAFPCPSLLRTEDLVHLQIASGQGSRKARQSATTDEARVGDSIGPVAWLSHVHDV